MKLMIMFRKIVTSIFLALFLISNGCIYANQVTQTNLQTSPINIIFEVSIDGVKYSIPTPINASAAPVTVKIVKDGNVVFQRIANTSIMVVGDGIDHRVVGDGIDHRVVGDGIDHIVRLEVSQSGIVLFNKQI